MNPSILMISFHYPPVQASSGLLRTLAFSRDLSNLGHDVTVLTSSIVGDDLSSEENRDLIPDNVSIIRSRALDAAKNLSMFGRYPGIFEWPDRFSSWVLTATMRGVMVVRTKKIDTIFSTYPIASAHLVGYLIAKITHKPWIADFRDPMVMAHHPDTPLRRRAHHWVERKTIRHCNLALFTSTNALEHYSNKYPDVDSAKYHVVENGFDEELFERAKNVAKYSVAKSTQAAPLKILHSGTLYPDHRDPKALFEAIKVLGPAWARAGRKPLFEFRGSGYAEQYKSLVDRLGIGEWVRFSDSIPYVDSIAEIVSSDALLLIQGASCNQQVPAKLYEYIRAAKPMLVLTSPQGATAAVLRRVGLDIGVPNDTPAAVIAVLDPFVQKLTEDSADNATMDYTHIAALSRYRRSQQLHELVNNI